MQLRATSLMAIKTGRRRAWTPAELGASLAIWLDAEDTSTITLNGANVSQWNDKSGNGRSVSQSNAAYQPPYSATAFNGKPCLNITAAFKYLQNIGPGKLSSATISFAGLYSDTNTNSRPVGYTSEISSVTPRESFTIAGDGALRFDGGSTATVALPTGNIIRVATRSPTLVEDFRNGGTAAISTAAPTEQVKNRINIGNAITDVNLALGTYIGQIAEVVFLSSVIATTDRQRLEGYYAWKWGLTANLPADHPFKNRPPTV